MMSWNYSIRRLAIFASLVAALALSQALAQTNHQVQMIIEDVEGREIPIFFYEPVGLLIQPGDTITFIAASPHHTVTAYHAQQVKTHRVPEGVEPFSSPVVPIGETWSYTFTVPGTYEVWCGPHEQYGMAMRIVVGAPGGPAEAPITDFSPVGSFALSGVLLSMPELASSRIAQLGSVSFAEVKAAMIAAGGAPE